MGSTGSWCALIPRPRWAGLSVRAPPPGQRQLLVRKPFGQTCLMPVMEPNTANGVGARRRPSPRTSLHRVHQRYK
eukprot:5176399-Alexandrium_andersonii.AAC.1